jgi:hypothetical protein
MVFAGSIKGSMVSTSAEASVSRAVYLTHRSSIGFDSSSGFEWKIAQASALGIIQLKNLINILLINIYSENKFILVFSFVFIIVVGFK